MNFVEIISIGKDQMIKEITIVLFLACCSVDIHAQDFAGPDTVSVQSGKLTLKGLLWRPAGHGPFPTIIFCHGSYGGADTTNPVQQTSVLGEVFAKKGYIFLILFRRGVGLSQGQGENSSELMNKEQINYGLTFLRRRQRRYQSHCGNRSFFWRITYLAACGA